MDSRLKARWIEALRSGKFKQAEDQLKVIMYYTNDYKPIFGYCCLGVLCEISPSKAKQNSEETLLSKKTANEIFGPGHDQIQEDLAELNDSGAPFEFIAGFIQENL